MSTLPLNVETVKGGEVGKPTSPGNAPALDDAPQSTNQPSSARRGRRLEVVKMADIAPEKIEWLWDGRIPRGKLTLLDGDPNLGKSTLVCELAACLSTGRLLPGQTAPMLADVLLANAEDGAADTVRCRLDAAGADVARVHILRSTLELPRDVEALEAEARVRSVGLIVLDPLMAYLGASTNSHRDQDVRRALAPLAAVAERIGAAVLAVRHLNKQPGASALYRGGGSIGIVGAARSALLLAADPETPSLRILASIKSNLAETPAALRFELESAGDVGRVKWLGECDYDANQLIVPVEPGKAPSRVDAAEAFICGALSAGPMPSNELEARAKTAGLSVASLRRARQRLGVATIRKDNHLISYLASPQSAQVSAVERVEHVEQVDGSATMDGQHAQHAQHAQGSAI